MNNSMEFNLELALKGYPIRTRFGHPVVLNKVDKKENKLYVEVISKLDLQKYQVYDNLNGYKVSAEKMTVHDLIMSPLTKEVEFCVTQKKFTDSISITEKSKYIEDSNEILIKKFNAQLHITLDEWKKLNINLIRIIEIIEENGETTIHNYF